MTTDDDAIARWREYREQRPGMFPVDETFVQLHRLVPRDGSCTCRAQWRINVAGGLGKAGWHCPEHGTVLPDAHGNPRQDETLEDRRAAAERARRAERNAPKAVRTKQRRAIAAQLGLGLDA